MNFGLGQRKPPTVEFADEGRILAEGQKDGERNIPEMGSYTPAPFEQALISHGEQAVQQPHKSGPTLMCSCCGMPGSLIAQA